MDENSEYDYSKHAAGHGPEWMTIMDVDILRLLALGPGLVLPPSVIAENIERSRSGVSRRLNTLQASGFVRKIDRGKYKISEKGEDFLSNPGHYSNLEEKE